MLTFYINYINLSTFMITTILLIKIGKEEINKLI